MNTDRVRPAAAKNRKYKHNRLSKKKAVKMASAGLLSIGKVNAGKANVSGTSILAGMVTASSGISVPGTNALNFGSDQTKATNAGSVAYQLLTTNALDIVGGGVSVGSRLVQITDNLAVTAGAKVGGSLAVTGPAAFSSTVSAGSTVSGFPISSAYNAGTLMVNAKVWVATATTTGGQATFYPTSTNASGGAAIFTTILSIQSNIVLQTPFAAQIPCTSVYSQTTSSIIISAIAAATGTAVANGTKVFCMVIGL